ncbi:hypothetical protein E1B28_011088 [Marasmius oreades]|uniref:AAA+ ATPase domain-containing protein n=1 Tax=Marasmius oreades TaxID=181124 RepID=A0A9P7RTH1_9AGAR|nr:uncharacterized protein E1B28_011088 [Marasmius oreades]KAG7089400.1 hypothetical protein E1B28_011088 [Marasmius oreades]
MSELASASTSRHRLRKTPQHPYTNQHPAIDSMHWLFRTNIPRRRSSYYQPDIRKRNFFGMGEIIGVLTNPAETVRSLTESKRLLDEARREINENRERAQIRPKHTFSRLPAFYARTAEMKAIARALEGDPAFTVLFGASSVGKTALLREVLCHDKYHVLHFDLRIAGFADLASLYISLSEQMEQYFEEISKQMDGYKEFEKEAWSFKHDRLNVERRLQDSPPESGIHRVKTSDIARLMELFQSSLLKYWKFEPFVDGDNRKKVESDTASTSDQTHVNPHSRGQHKRKWKLRNLLNDRSKKDRTGDRRPADHGQENSRAEKTKPVKKMPVIFFDEAHKLPALIQSTEAMNCLLSTFLVLTKQDRLCHVIHATSDPFYHTWLRRLNVMQHCKIITIGDCSRSDTRKFFREKVLPDVPQHLRPRLDFEKLYEAFGGKLVHWQDYISDYVNSNGNLEVKQSSHFLQAHALLNLHIIHSSQSANTNLNGQPDASTSQPSANSGEAPPQVASAPSTSGFRIYSAISHPHGPDSDDTGPPSEGHDSFTAMQLLKVMARITQPGVEYLPYFMLCREFGVRAVDGMVKGKVLDLRWTEIVSGENSENDEVDNRVVGIDAENRSPVNDGGRVPAYDGFESRPGSIPGYMAEPGSSSTAVNNEEMFTLRPPQPPIPPPPHNDSDEEMVPVSEREAMLASDHGYRQPQQYQFPVPPPMSPPPPTYPQAQRRPSYRIRRSTRYQSYQIQSRYDDPYAAVMEVVGPKLVPITPIMRYAMKEVIAEYQEEDPEEEDEMEGEGMEAISISRGSRRGRRGTGTGTGTDGASEYASLSDVDEY